MQPVNRRPVISVIASLALALSASISLAQTSLDDAAKKAKAAGELAEAITAWENAITAENDARDALRAAEAGAGLDETGRFLASLAGRALTVRRVDFRAVSLADDQGGVILTHDALAFFRLAA